MPTRSSVDKEKWMDQGPEEPIPPWFHLHLVSSQDEDNVMEEDLGEPEDAVTMDEDPGVQVGGSSQELRMHR